MAGEAIGILVGLAVAGAGATGYWYHSSSISNLQDEVVLLQRQLDARPVRYDGLKEVGYISLASDSAKFNCLYQDGGWKELSTKGIYRYHWSFEYEYSVDIPNDYDWKSNLKFNASNSSATLLLPPLMQTNPVKVQFDKFEEENRAGSKRFQRMYRAVLSVARNWTTYAGEQRMWLIPSGANPDIWTEASETAEARVLPLINNIIRQEGGDEIQDVNVQFEGTPRLDSRVPATSFNGGECKHLGEFTPP